LNKKEAVYRSIKHISQDKFPTQVDYTPEMKQKIKTLLDIDDNQVDNTLDNHIKYLPLNDKVVVDEINGIEYDIWGVGWDLVLTEGFHIRHHPLIDSDDLTKFKISEPDDYLFEKMIDIGGKEKSEYFLLSLQDWTLFERCWLLRGFENALTDLYFRKKEINYLLDGITEFQVEVSKKVVRLGIVDGLRTGDDVGTQIGLLMSPDVWREFFKKRLKRIWEVYTDVNLPVFHHSCGNIMEIIPDLIDIGLSVLTPIQPEAMNPLELSKRFGKKITFFGGISTQRTLPFGTPIDVRNEILDRIKILGEYNGYIIAPSHEITSDCKDENFLMLISTLKEYKNGLYRKCYLNCC